MRRILSLIVELLAISQLCYALNPPLDIAKVEKLFETGDFAALESMANDARKSREISIEGQWQLAVYYEAVLGSAARMAEASETKFRMHLDSWAEQFPKSTTWRIVKAHGLADLGWNARGESWAIDVSEEGWRGMDKYLAEAWTILQGARKISTDDPQLYVLLSWVALGMGRDPTAGSALPFRPLARESMRRSFGVSDDPKPLIDEIFEEAIRRERYYLPLYRGQITHHLVRWGGKPDDLRKFAEHAAEITRAEFGDAMYAYVAWSMLESFGHEQYAIETNFDWTRIKAGMERFETLYPDSSRVKNQFCRLACAHRDRETAKAVVARLTEPMPRRFWKNEDWFGFWKKWINEEVPYPKMTMLTPYLLARETDEVKGLIASGEDPNAYILPGVSPLMMSVMQNDPATAKFLISAGAKLDFISSKGNTILQQSLECEDLSLTKILLEAGADPNQANVVEWTALHRAVRFANFEAAELLLKYKANIDQPMANGWTPLHVAVQYRRPKMVRFLLEHGADPNLKLRNGSTPLALAKDLKFPEIASILEGPATLKPAPSPPPTAAPQSAAP